MSVLRTGGFITKLSNASAEIAAHATSETEGDADAAAESDAEASAEDEKAKGRQVKQVKTRLVIPKHIQDVIEGTSDDAAEHRFVNVVDILPPLPQKGTFDVTKIKNSLYFFS